jgi:phage FluMu protein Com
MGEILSFKKLDYSKEVEQLTNTAFVRAFFPVKMMLIMTIISFFIYFIAGYGTLTSFVQTSTFTILFSFLVIASFWLIIYLHVKLRCPNCENLFFKFQKNLEIKPRSCPSCKVIFVKKTHPLEDDYDYTNEFTLLKLETERRTNLAIFYLTLLLIASIFVLSPILSAIAGESLTLFIILPALFVFTSIYFIKQLETRCPSCSKTINWTELKPTEISKHCPHCDAKLAH